jgi:ubiquinone/menaquinone biosynthesis C-methylase UbiE
MARSHEKLELIASFDTDYRMAQDELMLELERAVCGCDYGGTSWTTKPEAQHLGHLLDLGPGKRLLELGAGSGWPGLFLAATSACDIALVDLPLEGLRIARQRTAAEPPPGACWIAQADGAALPLADGSFHAISHSDVLCCLAPKASVLAECRRVIRPGGIMAFTVIYITPGLAPADHARALEASPPYAKTPTLYPDLLTQTGWTLESTTDLTPDYGATVRHLLREQEARAARMTALLGEAEFADRRAAKRANIQVIEDGLLKRELFVVTPA